MKSEAQKRASAKYDKSHFKKVMIYYQKEYYYNELLPAIEASGETVGGYIKKAVAERMKRDVDKT